MKGKEKVSGEYSLVFLAYNMRRAMSILGVKGLIERIKTAFFSILALMRWMEGQSRSFGLENLGVGVARQGGSGDGAFYPSVREEAFFHNLRSL